MRMQHEFLERLAANLGGGDKGEFVTDTKRAKAAAASRLLSVTFVVLLPGFGAELYYR